MGIYKNWEFTKGCLKGTGGKSQTYSHYCPIPDFRLVVHCVLDTPEKGTPITRKAIENTMDGRQLEGGRTFSRKRHEYKLNLVFYVLEDVGILVREPRRFGRSIAYRLNWPRSEVQRWLEEVTTK